MKDNLLEISLNNEQTVKECGDTKGTLDPIISEFSWNKRNIIVGKTGWERCSPWNFARDWSLTTLTNDINTN